MGLSAAVAATAIPIRSPSCRQVGAPWIALLQRLQARVTVTVGTALERSKVPLTKWWMAAHIASCGKNDVSPLQIHLTIGVTYKTAWFMMRRLREATLYESESSERRTRKQAGDEGRTKIHPHTRRVSRRAVQKKQGSLR